MPNKEPSFGKVYHTADNKTVFIDPQTKLATIFEGILSLETINTIDTILEPLSETGIIGSLTGPGIQDLFPMFNALIPSGLSQLDFLVTNVTNVTGVDSSSTALATSYSSSSNTSQKFEQSGNNKETEDIDILGPQNYFVLAPMKAIPLSVGTCPVRAWVREYKNGHKPDYKGFHKHAILPEQWDWLNLHKTCVIVAWYDQTCPAFITLGCLDHAQVVKPVLLPVTSSSKETNPGFSMESSSIKDSIEHVLAEERTI